MSSSLTPRPFQEEVIRTILNRNTLDFDACGSGKTLVGVEAGIRLKRFPILIITPKTPRSQWRDTILQQTNGSARVDIVYPGCDLPQRPAGLEWVITHPAYLRLSAPQFQSISWPVIILDEGHLFRNHNTQQCKVLYSLRSWRRVVLTATPMHKSPAEIWSMLHWLYPHDFSSYWGFRKRYVLEEKNWLGYYEFVSTQNEDELAARLKPFTFRRTLKDLAPDLPPRITQYINIDPPQALLDIHEQIRHADDIIVSLGDNETPNDVVIANTLAQITYLRRLTSLPATKGLDLPAVKVDWVKAFVTENPELKVVVLAYFKETAGALADTLGAGLGEVIKFKSGVTNLLVGTYGTLGTGTDLPNADCIVLVDLLYQRIQLEQAMDRIYRLNITGPKFVKILHCPGTIDDDLRDAIENNWSVTHLVLEYLRKNHSMR